MVVRGDGNVACVRGTGGIFGGFIRISIEMKTIARHEESEYGVYQAEE